LYSYIFNTVKLNLALYTKNKSKNVEDGEYLIDYQKGQPFTLP